jgi:tetratricopeptide (TPR) repeat protein
VCRAIAGSLRGKRKQERFGVVIPAVQSRVYLARALAERGSFSEAHEQGRDAIRLAEEFDHPFSRCWACLGLAQVKNVQGEWLAASELLERASDECRRWKIGVQTPLVNALLGHVTAQSGRVPEGVKLLEQAVGEYASTGLEHFLSIGIVQLGQAYLLEGRTDLAGESAVRALLLAGRRGERGFEAWALHLQGEIAARRHGPGADIAIAHLRKAMAQASDLGMKPLIAHCNLALAMNLNAAGEVTAAQEHQAAAEKSYGEMGMSNRS